MRNPFTWLRYFRFALAILVLVVSVASGIPIGSGQEQGDSFSAFSRLVSGVADFAENTATGNGGDEEVLGEIVDEPIGTGGQTGSVATETPGSPSGVGGVIGGGESLGPDGDAITPVAPLPTSATGEPTSVAAAPTATTPASPQSSAQPSEAPSATTAPTPTVPARPTQTPSPDVIRLDDPVLQFLPEINSASSATGVPASIVAGIVRVESNGDPNLIANGSRIGLTGVSQAGLANQGVAPSSWNDPAANLLAGAGALAELYGGTGSWDAALEAYFGGTCDVTGACPGDYRYAVQAWSNYYSAAVSNPGGSGFAVLAVTWTAPPLAPYQGASLRPIPLPPGVAAPTPTPQPTQAPSPTPPPSATAEPTGEVIAPPTDVPTEPVVLPTEPPTPTIAPTATEIPTPLPQ